MVVAKLMMLVLLLFASIGSVIVFLTSHTDCGGWDVDHRFSKGYLRLDHTSLFPSLHGGESQKLRTETLPNEKREIDTTVGLALMGGSYTAANVGSAIMRGFQQQTIINVDGEKRPAMEGFDYTGGLSGGNLPNLVYAFAQNVNSDELLDASGINDPSLITKDDIEHIPKKSIFNLFTKSVWTIMPKALALSYWYHEHLWVTFVYLAFLQPFGVPRNKYFASEKHSDDYVAPRAEVKATPVVEFSMIGPPETYPDWLGYDLEHVIPDIVSRLVKSGTKLNYSGLVALNNTHVLDTLKKKNYQIPVPFMGTPDEIGTSFHGVMKFDEVSGETASPLHLPTPFTEPKKWSTKSRRFSIESLLALGTGLLPILFADLPDSLPWKKKLMEPMEYEVTTGSGDKRSLTFADGGYNDYSGIPSLVAKRVRKIVSVSIATPDQFNYNTTGLDPPGFAFEMYAGFFGVTFEQLVHVKGAFWLADMFSNHVFDLNSHGENQLVKLYDKLQSLHEAGNPMIATLQNLTVVDNPFWGTVAGERVDLTVIHVMGVPRKFSDKISHDVAPPPEGKNFTENGFFTNEELKFVPNLVAFTNKGAIHKLPDFALNPKGARMTSFLCSWMIKEAWEGLQGADGEMKFGGFKEIFEG